MQSAVLLFFKFNIKTRSVQQQLNICHHKMDVSSSTLLGSGAGIDNNHARPDTNMKLGRNVHYLE